MTGCTERASRVTKEFNGEEAERLLLHLYTERQAWEELARGGGMNVATCPADRWGRSATFARRRPKERPY
jgi:hypothetical protein